MYVFYWYVLNIKPYIQLLLCVYGIYFAATYIFKRFVKSQRGFPNAGAGAGYIFYPHSGHSAGAGYTFYPHSSRQQLPILENPVLKIELGLISVSDLFICPFHLSRLFSHNNVRILK